MDMELSEIITKLYRQCCIRQDRLDCDITLSKMSDMQRIDLSAMIDYMMSIDRGASYILAQVNHDLQGLKAGFLGLPEGDCFSPRSSGYAARVA